MEASKRMRSVANPQVAQSLDAKIRDSQRAIAYLEERMQDLQLKKSQQDGPQEGAYGQQQQFPPQQSAYGAPPPPPKDGYYGADPRQQYPMQQQYGRDPYDQNGYQMPLTPRAKVHYTNLGAYCESS